MKLSIEIDIAGVYISDFTNKIPVPELITETADGVELIFFGIDALKLYQAELMREDIAEGADQRNEVRAKVNRLLNRALKENLDARNSIKTYAASLFNFIYEADAHRMDKKNILEDMLSGIEASEQNWELEKAVKDSTFELGIVPLSQRLAFEKYANDIEYDFSAIKAQLITELNELKKTLVY